MDSTAEPEIQSLDWIEQMSCFHCSIVERVSSVAECFARPTRDAAVRVRVPLWPLAGFVLVSPEFKSSARLVNSQLVASSQLGFLILSCCI